MAPTGWELIPNELLLQIGSFLPYLRRHLLSEAWRRPKITPEDKHSRAWNNIFKSDRWLCRMEELGLYAFLAGSDVVPYYHGKEGPHVLALCLAHDRHGGRKKGGIMDITEIHHLFRECLQDHRRVGTRNHVSEYHFPDCHLYLNVRDATTNDHLTCVSEPRRLVGHKVRKPGFYSAYLNWNGDSFKYCEIGPEKIIGIRNGLATDVDSILGIELDRVKNKFPRRQHYFHYPGENLKVIDVWTNDGTKLAGWRRGDP